MPNRPYLGREIPDIAMYKPHVAVPAFYRAMDNVLKKYGTMFWKEVSAPAIRLCREGFKCGFAYARISNTPEAEHNKAEYEGFAELYLNERKPPDPDAEYSGAF